MLSIKPTRDEMAFFPEENDSPFSFQKAFRYFGQKITVIGLAYLIVSQRINMYFE